MSAGAEAAAGALTGLAWWLARSGRRWPPPGGPPRRRSTGPVRSARFPRRERRAVADGEVVALAERLAALARAGVPETRAWQVLAAAGDAGGRTAGMVAAMAAAGGSVTAGLRLAATGPPPGPPALAWLALAQDVLERSGAPPAAVLDRFAAATRAEIAQREERSVALAGPRATATVLAVLPLVAPGLGWLMGADPVGTLAGTSAGRCCLVVGAAAWLAGRWWTGRLVASAARAGS